MKDGQGVYCRGYFSNQKLDPVRGKARRATDASVILSVGVSDRGLPHTVTGTRTDEARRPRCAHRSQRVADIEGQIVRRSTEEDY